MTRLAGGGRREVIRRFTQHSDISAAVAGRAARRGAGVVHGRPGAKRRRRFVAGLAPLGGGNVGRRLA